MKTSTPLRPVIAVISLLFSSITLFSSATIASDGSLSGKVLQYRHFFVYADGLPEFPTRGCLFFVERADGRSIGLYNPNPELCEGMGEGARLIFHKVQRIYNGETIRTLKTINPEYFYLSFAAVEIDTTVEVADCQNQALQAALDDFHRYNPTDILDGEPAITRRVNSDVYEIEITAVLEEDAFDYEYPAHFIYTVKVDSEGCVVRDVIFEDVFI